LKNLLSFRLSNDTGTSGARDKSYSDRSTLSGHFAGHSVRVTDFVTPVTFSDRGNIKFGVSNSSLNSALDFFVTFLSESDVSDEVPDQDNSFEASSLTGSGHFLDRLELHDFFLKFILEEVVNNLAFFDGDRELEDFFKRLDFSVFDETAQFSHGLPFINFVLRSSALIFSAFTESSLFSHIF